MNVFDFAMDMERSGIQYYRQLAKRAEQEGIKRIFTMTATDETRMLERLQALKGRIQHTTMENSRALDFADNIFQELKGADPPKLETDIDAYGYVVEIEKSVCRLYEKAAASEPNEEVRTLLRRIVEEEREELDSLQNLYDFVNAPNEYLAWGEFSNLDEFRNFGRYEG